MHRFLRSSRPSWSIHAQYALCALSMLPVCQVRAQGTPALAWERHDRLRVVVSATSQRRPGDTLLIDYRLANSAQSAQRAELFVVRQNVRAYDFLGPVAWLPDSGNVADSMATSWAALEQSIAPGESADGFRQLAVGLLTITHYRVSGAAPTPQAILDADEDSLPPKPTVWENAVSGYTLGVDPLPTAASPASLGARLRNLLVRSCRLGWIDPPGVCNSLLVKLDAATRSIGKGSFESARGQLQALANEVEAQRDHKLTSEAASLLSANLAALLARLPAP